jgi:hypothetical protein
MAHSASPVQPVVCQNKEADPVFASFEAWARRAAGGELTREKLAQGVTLAKARRVVLAKLIESDPQSALELALPSHLRKAMPEAVADQLETPISARGDYHVAMIDYIDPKLAPGIQRTAEFGGKSYRAFVYGKRMWQPSKMDIPMHGIAIGDALAIHENPLHILNAEEVAALDPKTVFANVNGK